MGPFTKLIVGPAFTLGTIVGLASLTAPDDPSVSNTRVPAASSTYSHELLQSDADMTQQMSAPNANTSSQAHRGDGQLARSQNLAYVMALEEHQAGLDQMLAEPSP
jgi:hypothetical protein